MSTTDLQKMNKHFNKQKKVSWWNRRKKNVKNTNKTGKVVWKNKGKAVNKSIEATQKGSMTLARFGYALPGPVQVFTFGWHKMSQSMKTLIAIVFSLVLLFVPWGVFIYAGWAVGAAAMFLVSILFWIFSSLFNAIGHGGVALINGISSMILGVIVYVVEAVLGFLNMGTWENGRYLMENGLISYDQIASIPSLYEIQTPVWSDAMNTTIISKVLEIMGFNAESFNLFSEQFKTFYLNLEPIHAMVFSLMIVLIPLIYLVVVYYRNRSKIMMGYGG